MSLAEYLILKGNFIYFAKSFYIHVRRCWQQVGHLTFNLTKILQTIYYFLLSSDVYANR